MLISEIFRYPVKGLPPEALDGVELTRGQGIPSDRRFAVAHGRSEIDLDNPRWVPRRNFLVVAFSPALAAMRCSFAGNGSSVSLQTGSATVTADLTSDQGRRTLAATLGDYVAESQPGPYTVVEVPGASLTDSPRKAVSILNRSSLRDLEQRTGERIDIRRFRGNLWIDGAQPWEELNWVGGSIRAGAATLDVVERIERCAATTANPETGKPDLKIPRILKDLYGHVDFGVLAEVRIGGFVKPGDGVTMMLTGDSSA